ncbi:MAG TPA: hypothetical protein VNO30_20165 [Kofleriaceae bacterium]|nr:hypothetical protein [Kofleriaceae bacterium]
MVRILALVVLPIACACGGGGGGDDFGDDAPSPDAPAGATVTRTYQQGVSGYSGTRSVGISTYGGLGNVGEYNANGMTFADGLNDWCTGTGLSPGAYAEVWLLRFEELGVPAGARVVSATLTIHGHGDGAVGEHFVGQYLAAPWFGDTPISCAGCSNSPVGWRYRDGSGSPWGALGASAEGTDVRAGRSFRLPERGDVGTGSSPQPLAASLDPAEVQAWLDGSNYGVRIIAGVNGVHMGYVPAQRDPGGRPAEMRPKLELTYAVP